MNSKLLILIGSIALLTAPSAGLAAWSCGIDSSLLPHVYSLDVVDGQLRAFVGQEAQVILGEDGEWTVRPSAEVPNRRDSVYAEPCMDPALDEDWLRTNKERVLKSPDFEQRIGVCTTGSGKRWGGISFYGGEGSWGVGGIVEENVATGAVRYYRPSALLDYSTSHLEYFGGRLWIGTAGYGECGTYVGIGLLSAYFANDRLYADWVFDNCGFLVSDMLVHSDALWIATEMGLSKVTRSKDRFKKFDWINFVPTADENEPMRVASCDELYEELFQSTDLASAPPNDSGHPYDQLWNRVSRLRPNFAWQYVRKLNGLEPRADGEHEE